MKRYAILAGPGHNRVYFDTSPGMAVSELKAITGAWSIEPEEIGICDIGLPSAICFRTKKELDMDDLKSLGTLSVYYALFEIIEGGLLRPVAVPDFHTFPDSMVNILKYTGKTNEQLTRLMVNLALSACSVKKERITLLDPMCGKGTSLYEGFVRGFDVEGIEINRTYAKEVEAYVVRFLKEGRYKHKVRKIKQCGPDGRKTADGFTLTAAACKDDFRAGTVQSFKLLNCDTRKAGEHLKKRSCDIIVCDLPYGVMHGSRSDRSQHMQRSPKELLDEALPGWNHVLKTGGSMVLSFNEFTIKYSDTAELLKMNGFRVLDGPPYCSYLHRVDQAINRNLITAVKI